MTNPAALPSADVWRWCVAGLVVICWGVNFAIAKHALNEFDLDAFNALRFTGMLALAWTATVVTGSCRPVHSEDRARLLAVSIVGFFGYLFGFSLGVSLTTAFSASVLLALVPLWVTIIEAVRQGRPPGARQALAVAVGVAGVGWFVAGRAEVDVGWGDLIAVLVAGAYALYLLGSAPLVQRYPALTLTTYGLTVGGLPVIALCAPGMTDQDWSRVTPAGWWSLAWTIVVPVLAAWTAWSWVQQRVSSARIAPLLFLVPLISGLTAWAFLSEVIRSAQVAGTLLVLTALWLNRRQPDL